MSLSKASSFSVKIRMPVACGAKMWTTPFLMPENEASSCTLSDKSMKSISPLVVKVTVLFTTLKFDMPFNGLCFGGLEKVSNFLCLDCAKAEVDGDSPSEALKHKAIHG